MTHRGIGLTWRQALLVGMVRWVRLRLLVLAVLVLVLMLMLMLMLVEDDAGGLLRRPRGPLLVPAAAAVRRRCRRI